MVNKSSIMDKILSRAKGSNRRIVLPEGTEPRIIDAAIKATELGLGQMILVAENNETLAKIPKHFQDKIEIINPKSELGRLELYANAFYELRKHKSMEKDRAKIEVMNPVVFATMMLYCDDADGLVAGAITKTADVVRPAFQIIKAREGINKISSIMIMERPDIKGNDGLLFLADCGIIEEPTSEDLADIAVASATSAEQLFGIRPRVAMLSYSTKSDVAPTESIKKVQDAVKIIKSRQPGIIVDGEMQADAAIVPSVAKIKCPNSIIQGRANVLVFPDLNSANISYKLVQRIGGIEAVGPILQGLKKPVNDLSRGASTEEIVKVIALTILQATK
ncbi:MAG: phosphate acetyltransferase [Clostridia bacterium]|nr:phosphate acetyltransferase [Clostridia bacterium]